MNDREIRQVFEGQNRIHLEIKQLHRQLAMILDEQRRYVSVITDEIAKKGTDTGPAQVSLSESTLGGGFSSARFRIICNSSETYHRRPPAKIH